MDFSTKSFSLMQLGMARASHRQLPFKVIINLGLPVPSSQEITNGCLLWSPKAYQVLSIQENPTFKSPPRSSQEVN